MSSMPPIKHTKKWRMKVHQLTPSCTWYMTNDQSVIVTCKSSQYSAQGDVDGLQVVCVVAEKKET